MSHFIVGEIFSTKNIGKKFLRSLDQNPFWKGWTTGLQYLNIEVENAVSIS